MSKKQAKKLRAANRTKAVVAASALAALPMMAGTARAQIHPTDPKISSSSSLMHKQESSIKFWDKFVKLKDYYSIVGMENGAPIFRKAGGEMFTVDPNTGDLLPAVQNRYMKYGFLKMGDITIKGEGGAMQKGFKFTDDWIKMHKSSTQGILISGVDAGGHIILQNGMGQQGYLDGTTGDFVVIQGG